jgi:O-antigen ligase
VSAAAFVFTTAYVVLAHLSPAVLFPHLARYNIMVWLAAAAALASLPQILTHRSLLRSPQPYLVLGMTVAVWASLMANGQARDALRGVRAFLVTSAVFYMVLIAVDTLGKMRMLAFAVVMSAIYLLSQSLQGWRLDGIYSQYVYRQHIYNTQGDVIGEFARLQSVGILQDPNAFAQYLLVAASLLTMAWAPGRWRRNLAFVMLPTGYLLYGVLVTHSRGGLIGLSIFVFFLLEKRFNRIISLVLAGSLLRVLFWAGAAGPRSISASLSDPSTAGRLDAWRSAIVMFRASPVFGVGFQMFRLHYPSLTAHNSLLLCLAELGILGGLVWLSLIVFSLWDLNRIGQNDSRLAQEPELLSIANGVRIALFTFLGTSFFLSSTYVMTLYVLIGMAAAARQLSRRSLCNDAPWPSFTLHNRTTCGPSTKPTTATSPQTNGTMESVASTAGIRTRLPSGGPAGWGRRRGVP